MEEREENDQTKKDAYLPISRSLEVWRATEINSEDDLSASDGWLRGKGIVEK